MKNYTVQIMDTDFNTVEFNCLAWNKEQAMSFAFKGIKAEDVCMSAVFEEGSNVSLPVEPVDRFCIPHEAYNQLVIDEFFLGGIIMWHKDWRHRVYLTKEEDKPAEYYEAGGMDY